MFLGLRPYAHSRSALWAVSVFLNVWVHLGTLVKMSSRAGSTLGLLVIFPGKFEKFREIFNISTKFIYFLEILEEFRCVLDSQQRAAERANAADAHTSAHASARVAPRLRT